MYRLLIVVAVVAVVACDPDARVRHYCELVSRCYEPRAEPEDIDDCDASLREDRQRWRNGGERCAALIETSDAVFDCVAELGAEDVTCDGFLGASLHGCEDRMGAWLGTLLSARDVCNELPPR